MGSCTIERKKQASVWNFDQMNQNLICICCNCWFMKNQATKICFYIFQIFKSLFNEKTSLVIFLQKRINLLFGTFALSAEITQLKKRQLQCSTQRLIFRNYKRRRRNIIRSSLEAQFFFN